jgi:hypothetical protein
MRSIFLGEEKRVFDELKIEEKISKSQKTELFIGKLRDILGRLKLFL